MNNQNVNSGGEWYRSPLVLLAALILVAGLVAILVTSLGGSNDDVADAPSAASADLEEAATAPGPAFGGPQIAEVAAVTVDGGPLRGLDTEDIDDDAIGETAPVITAQSLATGTEVTLDRGTARVIGFFSHWCPHCQEELPELRDWLAANELPQNVEVIAVSTVVDATRGNYPPSAWFNAEDWATPVLVDDASATFLNSMGFSGFPAFVAIDANGVVVDRRSGNVGADGFAEMISLFASG